VVPESSVSVTDAREQLADLVNRVAYTGERVTLTRHGRPMAVLVSVADAERARAEGEPTARSVSSLPPATQTGHVAQSPPGALPVAARSSGTSAQGTTGTPSPGL
jgi:prevent-host-death family protein